MTETSWSIRGLRHALAKGIESPATLAHRALACANANQSRNTYLWQNPEWTYTEAAHTKSIQPSARGTLWGLPVSLKDCFDLTGTSTSCGTFFYRDLNGIAPRDSWLAERLRAAGCVITGKTHLHPLAYGITGENPDFGDCLQPRDPTALTGGSSSGAAASIQEGSAVFAIGTDTGGSIRSPAALCGLAGYRASIGFGDWRGGTHLASSFDTMAAFSAILKMRRCSLTSSRRPLATRARASPSPALPSLTIRSSMTAILRFSIAFTQLFEVGITWAESRSHRYFLVGGLVRNLRPDPGL